LIVHSLPVAVGLDQHRGDGVCQVSSNEKYIGHRPPLQILPDVRPGPDASIMSPARPVAVDVADEKLIVAHELTGKMEIYIKFL
jgi:hypothetical protein